MSSTQTLRSAVARSPAPWFFAAMAMAVAAAVGQAAPLSEPAAVQTRPDASAPAIAVLKAGTEPAAAPGAVSAPAGWMAVSVAGPFEGYVHNADLTKGLDVKPGSSIYLSPTEGAGVLAAAVKGQKIAITGLRGRWTQVRLDTPLVGYVRIDSAPLIGQSAAAPQTNALPPPVPDSPAPVVSTEAGKAAAVAADDTANPLPRFFEGLFVSSRRPLAPRRPYDWQLNDATGARIAYLDVGRLLLTDQIDNYVGHTVAVFGAARPVPGTRDIVIAVENLQLK